VLKFSYFILVHVFKFHVDQEIFGENLVLGFGWVTNTPALLTHIGINVTQNDSYLNAVFGYFIYDLVNNVY